MRVAAWMILGLLAAPLAAAQTRDWVEIPVAAPAWDGRTEVFLGIADGGVEGYGTLEEWAGEIQVCFELPEPEFGGPWMIEYAAFYLSGSQPHNVVIRTADGLNTAPGEVISEDRQFTPMYTEWPPSDWTYVVLKGGASCPDYLLGQGGECIMLGTVLQAGDAFGLALASAETRGWGYFGESWSDDGATWSLVPAVRIGLTDLGLSSANRSTWGAIKDLFQQAP